MISARHVRFMDERAELTEDLSRREYAIRIHLERRVLDPFHHNLYLHDHIER